MAAPPYEITHTITLDGILRFRRHVHRRARVLLYSISLLPLAIAVWMIMWPGPGQTSVLVGCTVISIVTLVGAELSDRWSAARDFRQLLGSTATAVVDERGIFAAEPGVSSHIDWSALSTVEATRKLVVLRSGSVPMLWFPRNALGDDARQEEILDFLRRHVSNASAAR